MTDKVYELLYIHGINRWIYLFKIPVVQIIVSSLGGNLNALNYNYYNCNKLKYLMLSNVTRALTRQCNLYALSYLNFNRIRKMIPRNKLNASGNT